MKMIKKILTNEQMIEIYEKDLLTRDKQLDEKIEKIRLAHNKQTIALKKKLKKYIDLEIKKKM